MSFLFVSESPSRAVGVVTEVAKRLSGQRHGAVRCNRYPAQGAKDHRIIATEIKRSALAARVDLERPVVGAADYIASHRRFRQRHQRARPTYANTCTSGTGRSEEHT